MATTLVSFLGTGQKTDSGGRRAGYRTTTYRFLPASGEATCIQTSLFGVALLQFLQKKGTEIDRWVVLGTSASLWSELNQALLDPDAVLEQYCQVDDRVIERNIDQAALDVWQTTLNERAASFEFRLCLTGEALVPESQQRIASVLFENIPRGNNVIFDISHGFRHQPIIATYVVSLMRWTHAVGRVSFYSGVWEARDPQNIAPVVELPICQELVDAAEAAAVLQRTGNYEASARFLGLDASRAWYFESTNQLGNARTAAATLSAQLNRVQGAIAHQLASRLRDRLDWSRQYRFADRFRESAKSAIEGGDYFRAVVQAYEALLIRTAQMLFPQSDPMNYLTRSEAERKLEARLPSDDRRSFHLLRLTRNACAHGTRADKADIQQILHDPEQFRALIGDAFGLFDRLPELLTAAEIDPC